MPYEVESPYAAALGFAGSYLQSKNAEKQRMQEMQRQARLDADARNNAAATLALSQGQDKRAALQDAASLKGTELTNSATQRDLASQDRFKDYLAKNPPPPDVDSPAYAAWASKTHSAGFSIDPDLAEKFTSGISTLQLGHERSSLGQLDRAKSDKETHWRDEIKMKYDEQKRLLGDRLGAELEIARNRIQGMLSVAESRNATAAGIAQSRNANSAGIASLNRDEREAISMRAAIISLQTHDQATATQQAMAEYKAQDGAYQTDLRSYDAGKPTTPGFDPTQMPQLVMPQQPQSSQTTIIMVPGPNGQPMAIPIVKNSAQHPVPHTTGRFPAASSQNAHAHTQAQNPYLQNILHFIQNSPGALGKFFLNP